MEDNKYAYWLHNVPGIGNKTAVMLLKRLKNAKEIYTMCKDRGKGILSEKQWISMQETKQYWNVKEAYEKMQQKGIAMVRFDEPHYPAGLRRIANPPFALYYLGSLPPKESNSLAIIGARDCSEYGRYMARSFAEAAARAGMVIISGMARGIDGISQQAALEAMGSTYAVLGCGVDICYPRENRRLYDALREKGGILSPYPPGTQPAKTLFPYRNEIVAGLSDAVLVVEARQKSGTLITVDMALGQGKDVYAVPGRLTDRLSDGCNCLIRQGAGIALSPEDVLLEIGLLRGRQEAAVLQRKKTSLTNTEEEAELLRFLDFYPLSADEIYEKMMQAEKKITLSELLCRLVGLCMQGKAKQTDGNYFVKGTK